MYLLKVYMYMYMYKISVITCKNSKGIHAHDILLHIFYLYNIILSYVTRLSIQNGIIACIMIWGLQPFCTGSQYNVLTKKPNDYSNWIQYIIESCIKWLSNEYLKIDFWSNVLHVYESVSDVMDGSPSLLWQEL